MGLMKDIEFKGTGIILSYWRVNNVCVDIEFDITEGRIGGYVSKADALAGKKSINSYSFKWVGPQNPIHLDTDPMTYQALIYAKLIEEPAPFSAGTPFIGATIVSDLPE